MALVDFLRARLDEREEHARAALAEIRLLLEAKDLTVEWSWAVLSYFEDGPGKSSSFIRSVEPDSPFDVLKDVEVKRALIEQHVTYYGDGDDELWPVQTLRLLSAQFDDHEDYLEEWRL
jgi:hypothetical protein